MIPGKLGRLEYHDGVALAVYSDRPRVFARLWAVPGVRRWQVGDQEARALVPADRLSDVATLIQARRRRLLTRRRPENALGSPQSGGLGALEAHLAPGAASG